MTCYNNGDCKNGICLCRYGFRGQNCEINDQYTPIIDRYDTILDDDIVLPREANQNWVS